VTFDAFVFIQFIGKVLWDFVYKTSLSHDVSEEEECVSGCVSLRMRKLREKLRSC
jgi:hypothetical protein